MATLFTKIINGDIPCYKIAEDENFIAFLDINPNAKGHTLCVPKKEVDKLFDLDDTSYLGLMLFSKKIAQAIEKVIPCNRVGISVIGLEIPHTHVHIIPINEMKEMTFTHKVKLSETEFNEIAKKIREAL